MTVHVQTEKQNEQMEKCENAVKDKPVLVHGLRENVSSLKVNEKSKRANLFITATQSYSDALSGPLNFVELFIHAIN
jgi:hypothetical protein